MKFFCKWKTNVQSNIRICFHHNGFMWHHQEFRYSYPLFGIPLHFRCCCCFFCALFSALLTLCFSIWLFTYCSVAVLRFPQWNAMRTADSHSHMGRKNWRKANKSERGRAREVEREKRKKQVHVRHQRNKTFCLFILLLDLKCVRDALLVLHTLMRFDSGIFLSIFFFVLLLSLSNVLLAFLQRSQSAISRWNVSFQMID